MGGPRRGPAAAPPEATTETLVGELDPTFDLAVRQVQELVGTDGALTAADKSVLEIAMAAVCDTARCGAATERALGCGVPLELLRSLALTLYLSRGARPAAALLDAVGPPPPSGTVDERVVPAVVPIDTILTELTAVFGELPPRVTLLAEHLPAALEAYHRMRTAGLSAGAVPVRLAELVLFAVNAAVHRADYAAVHARGARRAGVRTAELVEAGWCTVPYGGIAGWLAASEAIAATAIEPVDRHG